MLRRGTLAIVVAALCAAAGCDLLDPDRPTIHGDTTLFGNLLGVEPAQGEADAWWAKVRIAPPRAFVKAEASAGEPTPTVEEGLVADVRVTTESVVLVDGAPVFIEEIAPGTEVVVQPVAGTTRMVGTSNLIVEAAYLTDFDTYRRWQLPGLESPEAEAAPEEETSRIRSAGVEHAPIPVANGTILYFAARLRAPAKAGEPWLGARREGLSEPEPGAPAVERSYRTELTDSGWSEPELVRFEELDDAVVIRVSWVAPDESLCLVTVATVDGRSWIGRAERPKGGGSWGPTWGRVVPIEALLDGNPDDGVFLTGSRSKIVFTANWGGNPSSDLVLYDPSVAEAPQLLSPPINSPAAEWGARVGPDNQLLFVRGDRQMLFAGGELTELRLPTPHRSVVTEAAPTSDGEWIFLCRPSYRPVELDQDIWVARWLGAGRLGEPVPVDDWRP